MDKLTKRKLKRYWWVRSAVGVLLLVSSSVFVTKLKSYNAPAPQEYLDIAQSLETLKSMSSSKDSKEKWKEEFQELHHIARNLDNLGYVTFAVPLAITWDLEFELDQPSALRQVQGNPVLKQKVRMLVGLLAEEFHPTPSHESMGVSIGVSVSIEKPKQVWVELELLLARELELNLARLLKQTRRYPMLKQEGRVLERVLEKKRVLFREYERNLQSGTELKSALNHAKQAQQDLFVLIGVALLAFALLVILLRQRNPTSLSLTGQLNLVFPEECVAELGALREQLIVKGYPGWVVRLRMAQEILELVLAIYLQINIDNLWLPQKGSRKRNDE